MRLATWPWNGALLVLSIVACERRAESSVLSEPVADTALRPGQLGVPSAAVNAIVGALCDRAQRCSRIGAGRKYASRIECSLSTRAEWSEELNRFDCERGVDEGALRACLLGLSDEGCDRDEARGSCRPIEICERALQPPPVPLARDPAVPG
jgi:hypothetical protein